MYGFGMAVLSSKVRQHKPCWTWNSSLVVWYLDVENWAKGEMGHGSE